MFFKARFDLKDAQFYFLKNNQEMNVSDAILRMSFLEPRSFI